MPGVATKQVLRSIAANVRRQRLHAGLTQEQLAEDADLAARFLQQIERGAVNLSVDALVRLAAALEVAPTALFKRAELPAVTPGRPPGRGGKAAKRGSR